MQFWKCFNFGMRKFKKKEWKTNENGKLSRDIGFSKQKPEQQKLKVMVKKGQVLVAADSHVIRAPSAILDQLLCSNNRLDRQIPSIFVRYRRRSFRTCQFGGSAP
jgi:hypothetical protein